MVVNISGAHLCWGRSTYKGKTYKTYSLARAVRRNGKNYKEILVTLGKLSEEEVKAWKIALRAAKNPNANGAAVNELVVLSNYAHLDVAVALEVWRSWGFDQVFSRSGNHTVSLAAVAAALTINRSIDPTSKSGVSSWFSRTTLPLMLGIDAGQMNPSRIFRELDAIEQLKPELCDYLYKEHLKRDPKSMESVFYDLSSTTFSGTKCLLMGWGHCKEGYDNHMVLALVVNKKGLPVYWETLPGNTADVTTIEWLLKSLDKRFEIAKPAFIFDRGLVSTDNLRLLEDKGIKYISAMDRNQLERLSSLNFSTLAAVENVEDVKAKLVQLAKFAQFDNSTFYHEVPITGARRYILCFNSQLFEDQRVVRDQAVQRFMSFVKQENGELLEAKHSRNETSTLKKFKEALSKEHLEGCVKLELKKRKRRRESEKGARIVYTFECIAEVDKQSLLEKGKLDGFWMLVTNQTDTVAIPAEQIIYPYREKVIIESSFRDIKSGLEVSPVHVWTVDHVKAHYTICVLAHLINRSLDLRLKEQPGGQVSQDIISHTRLFEELASCHLNHLQSADREVEVLIATKPTEKQKELLSRIGLTHILKEEFSAKSLRKR